MDHIIPYRTRNKNAVLTWELTLKVWEPSQESRVWKLEQIGPTSHGVSGTAASSSKSASLILRANQDPTGRAKTDKNAATELAAKVNIGDSTRAAVM